MEPAMGTAFPFVLLREPDKMGAWPATGHPGLGSIPADGLANLKREWRHALALGLDGAVFPLAVAAVQSHHALPAADLSFVVHDGGLVCVRTGRRLNIPTSTRSRVRTFSAAFLGIAVVILTAAWAFAFHSIYIRPEPRIAAYALDLPEHPRTDQYADRDRPGWDLQPASACPNPGSTFSRRCRIRHRSLPRVTVC